MLKSDQVTKFIAAVMLLAGTSTGAGMLALPVTTGAAGLFPNLLFFAFSSFLAIYASFLFLEVIYWFHDQDINFVTMLRETLGKKISYFAFCIYLLLFYTLLVAYLSATADIVSAASQTTSYPDIGHRTGLIVGTFFLGLVLLLGTSTLTSLNTILTLILFISYAIMLWLGKQNAPEGHSALLYASNWKYLGLGIPVVMASFTNQMVLPSVAKLLQRRKKALLSAIILGAIFPFLFYVGWEVLALSVLPLYGEHGVASMLAKGVPATDGMSYIIRDPALRDMAEIFGLSAILTSALGILLSLLDCLADLLSINKTTFSGRFFLTLLCVLPPAILSFLKAHLFIDAINYAGSMGCVLLFIFFPALMVWVGRYSQNRQGQYRALGNKGALAFVILCSFIVFAAQIAISFKWLPQP